MHLYKILQLYLYNHVQVKNMMLEIKIGKIFLLFVGKILADKRNV